MSSLPLISHHLFVAAVAPEDRRRAAPRQRVSGLATQPPAELVALELLEPAEPAGERAPKPALAEVS